MVVDDSINLYMSVEKFLIQTSDRLRTFFTALIPRKPHLVYTYSSYNTSIMKSITGGYHSGLISPYLALRGLIPFRLLDISADLARSKHKFANRCNTKVLDDNAEITQPSYEATYQRMHVIYK